LGRFDVFSTKPELVVGVREEGFVRTFIFFRVDEQQRSRIVSYVASPEWLANSYEFRFQESDAYPPWSDSSSWLATSSYGGFLRTARISNLEYPA
jgi:hypothetical protein